MTEAIGRTAELEDLARFVEAASSGPAAFLLEGEAGIGKTTLWEKGIALATERGFRTLTCRATESEARFSYVALADVLGGSVDDVLDELPDVQRRAIEVALLRRGADVGVDQRTVSAAALGVLRALCRASPVLVAIDDQQWMDPTSAEVLGFAARRLTDEPVGFLAASRVREGTRDPMALMRALPEDRLVRVRVGALDVEDIGSLIEGRLQIQPARAVLRRVHTVASGNPFFALELARAVKEFGGDLGPGAALPVPEDLRDLLRVRLTGLPTATREILLLASALSRPTVAVLEAAASHPDDVTRALEDGARAGVVEVAGDEIHFTHPLFASAVSTQATIADRRSAHRRLARVITEAEERARHLALSTDEPDAAVADALEEASRHAAGRGAPGAAAELSELAAELTRPGLTDDLLRRRLMAADAWFASGDPRTAVRILESALPGCPPGPGRAEVLVHLGRIRWEDDLLAAIELLDEAFEQPRIEHSVRLEAHLLLTWCLMNQGSFAEAAPHVRAASELAEQLGNPILIGEAVAAEASLGGYLGRGVDTERLERAERFMDGVDVTQVGTWHPSDLLAVELLVADEFDDARERLDRALRRAAERGDEAQVFLHHWWLSHLEFRAGEWDLALRHSRAARSDYSGFLPAPEEHLIRAHRGEAEAVRSEALDAVNIADRSGHIVERLVRRWVQGTIEVHAGDPAAGRVSLWRAWELVRETGLGDPGLALFVPDAAEVLIRLGHLEEAEPMIAWLEERGRTLDRPRALATGARCRATWLATTGDLDGALASFNQAAKEHERLTDHFELARTLLALGAVRRRAKHKRPARVALEEALGIFERLGAVPWAERTRAELVTIGGRPAATGQLTPTEERVARLAAAGQTNREIGEALFLSVRTVETHLSHTYHKLGVRSRTELALALEPAETT